MLCRGSIGIMEKTTETDNLGFRAQAIRMV